MRKHLTKGRIIAYLLYLAMACTVLLGVTYARYQSVVTGTGTARTAAMEMNTTIDMSSALRGLKPGETKEIQFEVSNKKNADVSEVAQDYTITIVTTGNLPLIYQLASAGDKGKGSFAEASASSEGDSQVWTGGFLPAAETVHQYRLTVIWPVENADERFAGEIDLVTLTVDAKQQEPESI
ncbi:hypothetical protein MCG98_04355 [Ruminococcus sp. OA3]|uniref:hypothetical protein n=1 Tax=Ruminococcus sp. OA3 TaxID=2914164 RepID=UPI001F059465|nr:hypothetical protein [Ruminococcus sp. OA3]MCH1981802.1 hypothetical protein [Ruminococcus sp. OA3]